jgi:predicted extracellular nuclease/methionine-rich copper-binding protein CopC
MALGPGSIAFIGMNTAGGPDDWIAFVALDPIAAGTTIYFTDNELNGGSSTATTFNTGESYTKWVAPAGGVAAGTVVKLTTFDTTPVASVGTASALMFSGSSNRGLSTTADSVYAYLAASDATADTPLTHLAYINMGNAVDGVAPASLAAADIVSFTSGADSAIYSGAHSGQTAFSDYLALISNTANWTPTQSGATASSALNAAAFTETTAPVLSGSTPADNATNVNAAADIVVTFSEPVKAGTGNITITDGAGDVRTIAITDATQVTISGNTVTINPTADLHSGTAYDVIIPSGVITDTSGNAFAGIAQDALDFAVADTVAPTLSSSSPADNATSVAANANIVLTFSEVVKAGTGSITLTGTDGDVRSIDVNDPQVTISGSTVTINPTADLHAGVAYDVTLASGVITDLAGNAFAGIAQDALDFTVAAAAPANAISLTALDVAYTQNFDTLSNVAGSTTNNLTILGWSMTEGGGGARDNEQYAVDTGASTTGDTYSYGAAGSTDRALGELRSGTLIPTFGAFFFNATGQTITSLDISYTGEQWRLGNAGRTDQLNLEYSTDATDLSSGTWHAVPSLAFTTPDTVGVGAKNGNVDHAALSATITGLNVTSGETVFIRWTDTDASGADDGLAVDDFSLTPHGGAATPTVSISDASITEGDSGTKLLTFTVTRSDTSTAFTVHYATADNGSATGGSDYLATAGDLTFTAGGAATQTVSVVINGDTTNEPNETFLVDLSNVVNTTGATAIGNGTATGTIINDDVAITRIYAIQGSGHTSPLVGQSVTTQGIVTAVDTNGFYIQDATGDGNANTSDGIFVFTNGAPPASVVVGALVNVSGTVQEFTPADADPGSLSVTELGGSISVTQLSTGNALPAAVVIGAGGLLPPTSDLAAGASFFESLEGMRVTVLSPEATGPTNQFGEIFTVASNGANATGVNSRGDILISGGAVSFGNTDAAGGDFNPERIQIDPGLGQSTPNVNVGAKLNDVTGIVSYSFGNYEVLATSPVTVATPSPLTKTGTTLTGDSSHILIASYNAENLDPGDGVARFNTIASEIISKLNSPDIIALQEIQDNSGTTDNGVTAADQTLQMIINAINAAGGPTYAFIDNPFIGNDTNGGQPGGNIRTAFLYRTDHVGFVAGSLRSIGANGQAITSGPDTAQQSDPNHPFFGSRPPLAADFTFNGQTLTVVDDHFTSKGGSAVLLGSIQPPFDAGEVQRAAQAQAVNNFVDNLLASNANARIVVTGDFNDYQFEQPLSVLKGAATISNYTSNGADPINATATYTPGGSAILTDLQDMLPADQRFDYVFEGNAQTLDHMLASGSLAGSAQFQPVHINSEFFDQTSDHDPLVGLFSVTAADVAPPGLTVSSPLDNATDVAIGANVVLTFSEAVQAGSGNIILRPATGADITIAVGSSQVTFNGNQVIINPTADLRPGVAYDVIIGSGVITDTSGNPFGGIAQDALDFTTSFTIPAGSFTQTFTISDPGTFTLLAGTTRTQTAGVGVTANVSAGSTTIDIEGTLNDTASGQRAINATLSAGGQITIGVNGSVQSLNADTIRVLAPNAKVDFTNLGQIVSGSTVNVTPNGSNPGTGFALSYNAVVGASGAPATDYTSGGVITNGAVNNTTALIQSNSGDAIRMGSHTTLINYGTIKGNGPVNDSNNNNGFNSNPNDDGAAIYDTSRGVRFNQAGGTAGKVENFGTIEGAQHGIDVGQADITNLVINNHAGGTILGHNGSGVGADTTGAAANTLTVENFGVIRGEYAPTFDRVGFATLDGDADGVDVDGAATIINHQGATIAGSGAGGNLTGQGAGGYDSNGRANNSEGVSIGGGIVVNDGLISGANFGITVNNDSNSNNSRSGVLATTITNGATGTIIGQAGFAIRLENKTGTASIDNDTIVNFGTIIGNGSIPDPNGTVLRQDGLADPGVAGTLDGVTYTSLANAGNARFISGDGSAIQMGEGDDTLTNHGTITGHSGRAVNMEGGADTLNLYSEGTISGRIDGGAGNDTIDLLGSGSATLANVINVETLVVQGGTWTIADAQSYANGVSVAGGALLVNASLGASAITVTGGTLGGSGSVGAVTIASGATLSPGASPATLSTGNLSFAAGATFKIEIAGSGAGQFDQISVTGTVNLAGATLAASLLGGFNPDTSSTTSYAIIANDGADAVTGTFAGLAEGALLMVGTSQFAISYHGGDGNDVVLTAVNNAPVNTVPATLGLDENASLAIAGLAIADPDAGSGTMTTKLGVEHGTVTIAAVGGAAVTGSGSASVTLSGTLAQINATLSAAHNIVYAPVHDFVGNDTLTVTTNDNGHEGFGGPLSDTDTVKIVVNNVPQAPVIGTGGNDSFTVPAGDSRFDALGGVDTITFGFKLVDATISFSGNRVIVDGPGGSSHTVLTGFEIFKFTDGTVNDNDADPLVDDLFYYSKYHDVWNAHLDADSDFHTVGWKAGRNPDAFFSTSTYLSKNTDVKAAGIDPLVHFDQFGWKEGRDPSILFDPAKYLAGNPDVAAAHVDPLAHFLQYGAGEGRQPIAPSEILGPNGFDYVYYLQHNPDVAAAGVDPFQHFETVGWKEGRNPNAYFDTAGYLTNYADVAAAHINPLDHYNQTGWKEGRDPSVNFDTTDYLSHYPDVAAAHVNPLLHFLTSGLHEGRSSFADGVWG